MRQFEFQPLISKEKKIQDLFSKILFDQDMLYIKPYKVTRHLNFQNPFVDILGPNGQAALKANNKIFQRRNLEGKVSMAPGGLYTKNELENAFDQYSGNDGVFLSTGVGGGGSDARKVRSKEELAKVKEELDSDWYVVNSWIPDVSSSPCINGIVARDGSRVLFSLSEQRFPIPLCCDGSEYPTNLGKDALKKIDEETNIVADQLVKIGFEGYFGVDYIVRGDEVYFVEINARYNGCSGEVILAHELSNIRGLTIPEIELYVHQNGTIPSGVSSPPNNLFWEKSAFYNNSPVRIKDNVGPYDEGVLFRERKSGIFNTYAPETVVQAGRPIGTLVSVADSMYERSEGMKEKIAELENSFEVLD